MKRKTAWDPYRAVLQKFNRRGIRYVVIGMAGINYYARNPSELFGTLDYDIFLEPTIENVTKALDVLQGLDFTLGTAAGPLIENELPGLVQERKTLIATTPHGLMIELLLKISGYFFSELLRDATTFSIRGVPVKVGRLTKLLRSKRLAARAKDIGFLKRYQSLLEESSGVKLKSRKKKRGGRRA